MPSSVLIRSARHDEGAVIADVQTRSWRETYARDLPEEALAELRFEPATWAERIAEAGRVASTTEIHVAELNDHIVGFAASGADREAGEGSGVGQLYAIYVLRETQGTGVGRRLLGKALDSLRGHGFTEATLWVLQTNASAIRFYEIADWRADGGKRIEEMGGLQLPEVRYRRTLGQPKDDY